MTRKTIVVDILLRLGDGDKTIAALLAETAYVYTPAALIRALESLIAIGDVTVSGDTYHKEFLYVPPPELLPATFETIPTTNPSTGAIVFQDDERVTFDSVQYGGTHRATVRRISREPFELQEQIYFFVDGDVLPNPTAVHAIMSFEGYTNSANEPGEGIPIAHAHIKELHYESETTPFRLEVYWLHADPPTWELLPVVEGVLRGDITDQDATSVTVFSTATEGTYRISLRRSDQQPFTVATFDEFGTVTEYLWISEAGFETDPIEVGDVVLGIFYESTADFSFAMTIEP